jgi:hypothetical protein
MNANLGRVKLKTCEMDIVMEKYSRRNSDDNNEGDDLVDLGRKSYQFTIRGKLSFDEFKKLDAEARKRGNVFKSDFGTFSVVVKRLEYKTTGEFVLSMVEDIIPDNDVDDEDEDDDSGGGGKDDDFVI